MYTSLTGAERKFTTTLGHRQLSLPGIKTQSSVSRLDSNWLFPAFNITHGHQLVLTMEEKEVITFAPICWWSSPRKLSHPVSEIMANNGLSVTTPWPGLDLEYDGFLRQLVQKDAPFLVRADRPKKIAWIVTNCRTKSKREAYVRELSKYIDVDIMGKCGTIPCGTSYGNATRQDNRTMAVENDYKFYLAFENSFCGK